MKYTYLFFLIPVLLVSACAQETGLQSPVSRQPQIFYLPEYPEDYPKLVAWKTVIFTAGHIQTNIVSPQTKEVKFIIKRNNVTPFLAYPITETPCREKNVAFFFPAGCIYPYSTKSTWTEGFGAQLAMDLLQRYPTEYRRIQSFNWSKLQSLIQTKSQDYKAKDKFFSPWLVNKEKLVSDILRGKATTYSVRLGETIPVSFPDTPSRIYYRYVPNAPLESSPETFFLSVPKEENFSIGEDNLYLTDWGIFSVMARKKQNGLLVTRQIEEYTVH